MKRVQRAVKAGLVPFNKKWISGYRGLQERGIWKTDSGNHINAVCLDCPDSPCSRFTTQQLSSNLYIEVPLAPDPAVCPTNAIFHEDSFPIIDPDICTACGLCVMRCPVGAIELINNTAVLYTDHSEKLTRRAHEPSEHLNIRGSIAESLCHSPRVDPELLLTQIHAIRSTDQDKTALLRLLTRNTFIISGLRVRLTNPGDHNALAECVADHPDIPHIYLFEIEADMNILDSIRRLLRSIAIAVNRYELTLENITPVIVLTDLPNKRVDYYEVVANIEARLGISIRTITASVLLAQIQSLNVAFINRLQYGFQASSRIITLPEDFSSLYTILPENQQDLGLRPAK